MKKSFLIILILAGFVFAAPVLAKERNDGFWASLIKIVQETLMGEEAQTVPTSQLKEEAVEESDGQEEYVDPREIKQVLREIKDMRRELNRIAKQLKKLPNSADDMNLVSALLGQIANF